ncbi:MAG: hypothetical protein PHU65_07875, partial [Actinomycetota bacterium]|nr:hypothetical protein [Actinomycetota bacterium]
KNFIINKLMKKNGNITILILIIGIVILISVGVLSSFMIKDIRFIKYDEEKLKALNFAEAGISNFFLEIVKYNKGETEGLPESPFTGEVISNEEVIGTYEINYLFSPADEDYYNMASYEITSKGIDLSGAERVVRVSITLGDIYDFIFSYDYVNGGEIIASQSGIYGPFFTKGSLDLRGGAGFYIGPLIVEGDIITGGNSQIGTPLEPVDIFIGGDVKDQSGNIINLTDNYQSEGIYIRNYNKDLLDIESLLIDENYFNELISTGAATVDGNLTITSQNIDPVPVNQDSNNYIRIEDNRLKISGNILVNGDIIIGRNNRKENIFYEGKGNLISKNNIIDHSRIIPFNLSQNFFPESNLLVLTAGKDISFLTGTFSNTSYENPNAALASIAGNRIITENNEHIRGLMIGREIILSENTNIYYEYGISLGLPSSVPDTNFIIFNKYWQELSLTQQ